MSAIIKTLKTTTNDVEQSVYPKTVLEAVVDAETNETLDVILDNLNEKIDNIEPGGGGGTTYELSRTDDTITLTGGDGSSSEVSVSDKVSKSGDTMTGDLTVKANVNIPLLADNSDSAIVTVPTAGTVDIGSTDKGITDVLTSYKSFMGSIHTKDAWNNIISTRHRNGVSDGVSHGMYLRSLMNRNTPDLMWAVQAAGTWQNERAILDSGNYSNYAVPKTGGTFTGDVGFDKGVAFRSINTMLGDYFVHKMTSGTGSTGYWKFATLNTNGTYIGGYLKLTIDVRGACGDLSIGFNGSSSADGVAISVIKQTGGLPQIYIIQNGKTFDLYMAKGQWAHATVIRLDYPYYMRERLSITWLDTFVSSLPSGTTSATVYNKLTTENYSTEVPTATQSAVGLMSAADKKKLDGIATGANKITVDSSLSSTSTNPVQNKAVHSHMAARLQLTGGTMTGHLKFNNNYGVCDQSGYQILVVNTTTVSPTSSLTSKKPIYVGNTDSSFCTYIRGYGVYAYTDTYNLVNKSWTVNSDQRIKTNSILLNDEDKYLTFFDNLKPRNYNYTRDEEGANKSIGFYAQEIEEALLSAGLTNQDFAGLNIIEDFEEGLAEGKDEAVYYKKFYTLSYEQFIPIVVNKIQHMEKEFNAKIEKLEQKIEELTGGTE